MYSVRRDGHGRRRLRLPAYPSGCRRRLGLTAAAALVAALAHAGPAAGAGSVAGGAYGVYANVNAVLAPVSVGALPSVSLPAEGGGPFTESALSANLAGLAPVRLAKVSTEGNSGTGSAKSAATVLDASIAGLVTVAAARSRCSATSSAADGSASVVDLVVAGIPISTVDAGPNTSIALPVGRVIINEQRRTGTSQITVNAVRVTLDLAAVTGEIVVAQSRCAVRSASRTRTKKLRARRSARS